MAVKVVVFACLVAAVSAGVLPGAITYASPAYQTAPVAYSAPIAKVVAPITKVVAPIAKVVVEEYDAHPRYSFAYDVQDSVTGDSKNQQETRDGDVVQGSYSVVDPDGTKRTVDYTADPQNGFNAVVRREPLGHVAKVAAVAPIAKIAAPVTYSAAPVYRTAPVVQAARIAAPVVYFQPIYH